MVQLIPTRRNDVDKATGTASDAPAPIRLVVRMLEHDHVIATPIKPRLIIGRGGSERQPDIDLMAFDASECGVSRWHAAFHYDENEGVVYIEDLNSTNGTRLNGFQIETARRYRLRSGDEIELGKVRISAALVRMPL